MFEMSIVTYVSGFKNLEFMCPRCGCKLVIPYYKDDDVELMEYTTKVCFHCRKLLPPVFDLPGDKRERLAYHLTGRFTTGQNFLVF